MTNRRWLLAGNGRSGASGRALGHVNAPSDGSRVDSFVRIAAREIQIEPLSSTVFLSLPSPLPRETARKMEAAMRCNTFIKLPRALLARRDVVRCIVHRAADVRGDALALLFHAFAFKDRELEFARELLAVQSQLWLYRVNQRSFAGDFVVVDASSPDIERRRVYAVELKRGARIRVHTGTPLQLRNAALVVTHIARTGAVSASRAPEMVTGDEREVIAYLRTTRTRDAMPRA